MTTPAEVQRTLFEESVRGFLLEHHLPFDTADEWTDAIVAIAADHPVALADTVPRSALKPAGMLGQHAAYHFHHTRVDECAVTGCQPVYVLREGE